MALRFLRVNVHVLTVFLLVGLPIFAIAAFLAIGSGQSQLRQSYGQQLSNTAEHTAAALDAYIYRRIIDASVIARVAEVRAAAAAGNRIPFDRAAAQRLTQTWMEPPTRDAKTVAPPMPAARFFAEVAGADPLFREIVATDASGRIVATFTPRSTYFVAGEAWWQEVRGDGLRGRVTVGDIQWDKRARAYSIDIAAPITNGVDERVAGALHVVLDAREMLALIADVQPGDTGNAFLLRADGTVVYSGWEGEGTGRFYAADLISEKLRGLRATAQPPRLSLTARASDGSAQMIGLAQSQLGLSYPHLSWLVAVSQAESELFAPVRSTGINLLLALALTAVGVLGFTLWDSRRLAARPQVMEPDLQLVRHPKVHWIEEEDEEEEPERSDNPVPTNVL